MIKKILPWNEATDGKSFAAQAYSFLTSEPNLSVTIDVVSGGLPFLNYIASISFVC